MQATPVQFPPDLLHNTIEVGITQELPFQEPPACAQDADISELEVFVEVEEVLVGITQELPFQEPPACAQDADISELLDVVVLLEVGEFTQAVPSQY